MTDPIQHVPFTRFKEPEYSEFLCFNSRNDKFERLQADMQVSESDDMSELPKLGFLRLELHRFRPGMSDFVIRVSSPKFDEVNRSNTKLSIRGNNELAKVDGVKKLAEKIGQEMHKEEDDTHAWDKLNTEHLTKMLVEQFRHFVKFKHCETLCFQTEALL